MRDGRRNSHPGTNGSTAMVPLSSSPPPLDMIGAAEDVFSRDDSRPRGPKSVPSTRQPDARSSLRGTCGANEEGLTPDSTPRLDSAVPAACAMTVATRSGSSWWWINSHPTTQR